MDDPETAVEWRAFDEAAFAAARREDVPVLLSIGASWCLPCVEMDREVYADPELAGAIHDGFVPIRVDADRRPRVRDRYTMGGFPSTVFLTPDGELLTGATQLGPDAFRDVIERVREMWAEKGADAGRVPRALRTTPPAGDLPDVERRIADRLREAFDSEYGGWGDGPKFPLPRTVEFALARDPELATRTLDPIRQHLFDPADGGFFRYAENRDWSDPHREKLLDANAGLLRAFANGYLHTGEEAYRETAEGLVDFVTSTLWTDGGFAAGRAPPDPDRARSGDGDRGDSSPEVDPTFLADRNALAIDASLTYHAYTDDERAREYAERALGTLDDLIANGAVRRFPDPDAPAGTLLDQARTARAFATAAQVLGRDHLETARGVADRALSDLLTDHGFVDGRGGPGLLDRPLYPIDANAEMADALVDVAALSDEDRYREAAREALSAFAGALDRFGPEQAGYATAVSRVVDPPLRIEVADRVGSDLHRAALRIADHEKVVVPGADGTPGTATVFVDGEAGEPVSEPAELVGQVETRVS